MCQQHTDAHHTYTHTTCTHNAHSHTHKRYIILLNACDTNLKICINVRYLCADLDFGLAYAAAAVPVFNLYTIPYLYVCIYVCSISSNQSTTLSLYLLPMTTPTTRTHCMPTPQDQLKGTCRLLGMLLWNRVIDDSQVGRKGECTKKRM